MIHPARSVGSVDPQQRALGLSPLQTRQVDHPLDVGPPAMPAIVPTPRPPVTEVAVVTPFFSVVQVSAGVAIFGTAGGRAVTP
jgi:hypothetical protein